MCAALKSPPPGPAPFRPWVIFLVNRRELGAAVMAVHRGGLRPTSLSDRARRFRTKKEALDWLRETERSGFTIKAIYRPIVARL